MAGFVPENWHGFEGPIDFFIPDNTTELIYSGMSSAFLGGAAYVMHHRAVTTTLLASQEQHVIARVFAAYPKSIYPKAALRAAVGRTITRGGWMKGAALVGSAAPPIALMFTVLSIAYSIPPSGRARGNIMPGDIRYTHIPE